MLASLQNQLENHAKQVRSDLAQSLSDYFDPKSGRFEERIQHLIKEDGDLERVLKRQIGKDGSQLAETLAEHVGVHSPLFKVLSPDESKGLLAALKELLEKELVEQRTVILEQFSLDKEDSALKRLVGELRKNHGELSTG